MDQYKIIKKLGDGTYGQVFKGSNIQTGQIVAIKKFKKKYHSFEECLNLREVKALQKLKHHNIIKLLEVFKEKDELNLVFEFLDLDIYKAFIENKHSISEDRIRNIIRQVVEGLAYMHKNGYFHRDLKPENLLIHGDTVKICDFGLAREVRSRPPYTDYVATRWYRAPEILLKQPNYNTPVDIFALGCIMAELYNMEPLFNGTSELDQLFKICQVLGTPTTRDVLWPDVQKLASASNISFPQCQEQPLERVIPSCSKEALQLIKDMLKYDPLKRPSAKQILDYPYFQDHKDFTIPKMIEFQQPRLHLDYHPEEKRPLELPRVEQKKKMLESDDSFYAKLDEKIAEYDRAPTKKETIKPIVMEKRTPAIDQDMPTLELRKESRKANQQLSNGYPKLLKYNDPLAEKLQQQQQQYFYLLKQTKSPSSHSYEPTVRAKANLYNFEMQLPNVKPLSIAQPYQAFQPFQPFPQHKELPKKYSNMQNFGMNYPRSLPSYQAQKVKLDDLGFAKKYH
ncbi:hypothetical protein pb186bvf_006855 [Paramecium bursaria]